MHNVLMPRIDAAMQSGRIVEWLKKQGENVIEGEPLVLVEGEKTTFEIEAPTSGTLHEIYGQTGTDVTVGEVVAVISEPGEVTQEAVPVQNSSAPLQATPVPVAQDAVSLREVRASPAARALARQHSIDVTTIKGTGPHGRIQIEDVMRVVEGASHLQVSKEPRIRERIPLKGIRKAVAERLAYSFHSTIPVMLTVQIDMDALAEARKATNASVTAFVVKAVAAALRDNLILNSSFDQDAIRIYDDINIAVAIDTAEGLMAPVIVGPEKLSLQAVSSAITDLRTKALSGKLTLQELTGGTFTVTNLGGEGVDLFSPIINPPQSAILAIGQVARKPVVIQDSVGIRSCATASLIFDHRVTDGVPAAKFLLRVKSILEKPSSLLAE
jgi:pyruvate dehydrogenase E2 component (dihydrolipoamide acetyltransferase)